MTATTTQPQGSSQQRVRPERLLDRAGRHGEEAPSSTGATIGVRVARSVVTRLLTRMACDSLTLVDHSVVDNSGGAAFVRGDESALKAAYDTHGPLVYSFCRRSVGDDRAKDVTQEVFVSA